MEAEDSIDGCHLEPSKDDRPEVENLNSENSAMSEAASLSSAPNQSFLYHSSSSSSSDGGLSLAKEEPEHARSGSSTSFSNGYQGSGTIATDTGQQSPQNCDGEGSPPLRQTRGTPEATTKERGGGEQGVRGIPGDAPPEGGGGKGGGTPDDAPPVERRGGRGGGGGEGGEDGEGGEEDDFAWGAAKHIFVLSSAGKPVFSLSGDEQHLATLTGLIQGLLSLCEDCDGDEMESISAGSRKFVFLKRGDLVLVAVSSPSASAARLADDRDDGGAGGKEGGGGEEEETEAPECESFLRLQLEYMYASILFLLTSKVQDILRRSPGYDLRGLLGGADTSLRGAIDLSEPSRGRGRMLAGGVETVWMDPSIRTKVSRALQAAQAAAAPSALYALWLCGDKLVSLAQPKEPSHRLDSRDLLLLVNFVATQPALRNAESWTPVCFPRFQEKGHLYAYIAFLEEPPSSTPARPTTANGKLASGRGGSAEDSAGERDGGGSTRKESGRDEDYRLGGESCVILVSVEASSEQFQAFRRARIGLETRFRSALGKNWDRYLGMGGEMEREGILTKFCTQMQALHFYYCLRGRRGGAPCVTQCLSSPFVGPLADDPDAQRVVWGCYTRAALRLRRGSCQEGRVFCGTGRGESRLDEQRSSDAAGGGGGGGGGGGEGGGGDQATALFDSDPVHSLTYEIGPKVTVMSVFGRRSDGSGGGRWTSSSSAGRGDRDELHACFPSSVPPEVAYKAAIRLVTIVRRDRDWLFLTGTGAPK